MCAVSGVDFLCLMETDTPKFNQNARLLVGLSLSYSIEVVLSHRRHMRRHIQEALSSNRRHYPVNLKRQTEPFQTYLDFHHCNLTHPQR